MALGRLWAGKVFGTNNGNLFVKLEGEDATLRGTLRFNDTEIGLVAYAIAGSFDGNFLTITGEPQTQSRDVELGRIKASATLKPKGELEGEWETDVGTAGAFFLFPHDRTASFGLDEQMPARLHTARHQFGAIRIFREQIITLAESIQQEFTEGKLIVTIVTDSEQSRFLEDFKALNLNADKVESVKLFVQEPEIGGSNKIVTVEFSPQSNSVMAQGASEEWVLGKLEKLERFTIGCSQPAGSVVVSRGGGPQGCHGPIRWIYANAC